MGRISSNLLCKRKRLHVEVARFRMPGRFWYTFGLGLGSGRIAAGWALISFVSASVLDLTFVSYRCLRNKRPSKPCELIGFVAMDVTKP